MPEELWMEVPDIAQETGIKTIPMEKKCKKAKWLSGEALQIAVKRREAKSKGCRGPAWGTLPMAKVMRKEAWHMQRRDRASGDPPVPKHLPPKPESAYFTASCSHLHLWLYGGLSPTTSLGEGVNLGLQLIKFLGVIRVFQFTNSSESSLACLTGWSSHMWLFTASPLWEARDALNFLNTDYFEKLENYSIVGWLEIILVKGFHLLGQYLLLSRHIPCPYTH